MHIPSFNKYSNSSRSSAHFSSRDQLSSICEDVVALIESADYATALRFLDDALALNLMDYHAWTLRGVVLVYLGRYEAAITSCDRALTYQPNHTEAWKFRGLALHGLNRYREAHESYDRALGIIHRSPIQNCCTWLRNKLGKSDSYDYQALML
ncbi:MAG: tetratricopeptide repeat protein [Cyanobacteria bacterium P01_E01_bin.6]